MVVWVIVNIEEWNPLEAMPRTVLTPPAGGSPMPDIPNWAWHEYGNCVGFWRMLAVFDELNIHAVLAIDVSAIRSYDGMPRAALYRGWVFWRCGFSMKHMRTVEIEREHIVRTGELI